MLYVKEKETGKIHKVWKYLLSGDDCVFAKSVEYSSNKNNKPLVNGWRYAVVAVTELAET